MENLKIDSNSVLSILWVSRSTAEFNATLLLSIFDEEDLAVKDFIQMSVFKSLRGILAKPILTDN